MAFETLLGNDRLKQNLSESLARGHISHFYLISGPKGSGKHTLAGLLAEAGNPAEPVPIAGKCVPETIRTSLPWRTRSIKMWR